MARGNQETYSNAAMHGQNTLNLFTYFLLRLVNHNVDFTHFVLQLDKDPENFNEEDLRQVFDYEAKVKFRNEERDKYRKMLHAEYAKLSQVLNEGIVKFNQKVLTDN